MTNRQIFPLPLHVFLLLLMGSALAPGCMANPSTSGPSPNHDWSLLVVDYHGNTWPRWQTPRRPRFRLMPSGGDTALMPELLLREVEGAPPLMMEVEWEEDAWVFTPDRPLVPGASYRLELLGVFGLPSVVEIHIAEQSGAVLTNAWPASGTHTVPSSLERLALRFDDALAEPTGRVRWSDLGAEVGRSRLERASCVSWGWDSGFCYEIDLKGSLRPGERYLVEPLDDLVDWTGAPVDGWRVELRTVTSGRGELRWLPLECALDEERILRGCLLRQDHGVRLRLLADRPVRMWFFVGDRRRALHATRGESHLLVDGLSAGRVYDAVLLWEDLEGQTGMQELRLRTHADLPEVYISEVLADPRGPEPDQEFVEIVNGGEEPVELSGFSLSDREDRPGDLFPEGRTLEPGARALLVSDRFDPRGVGMEPLPGGVTLIRLGSSLGVGGLRNSGEALFLRDELGRRVSASPALPSGGSGVCIVRTSADGRDGRRGAFEYDGHGSCSPGWPTPAQSHASNR